MSYSKDLKRMSPKYIEYNSTGDWFKWVAGRVANDLYKAGLPIYYTGTLTYPEYGTQSWIWYMAYDLGTHALKDYTLTEVAFIYRHKDLRDKWSTIMSLDPDYFLTPVRERVSKPRVRSLLKELEAAGYSTKDCVL